MAKKEVQPNTYGEILAQQQQPRQQQVIVTPVDPDRGLYLKLGILIFFWTIPIITILVMAYMTSSN